MKIPKNITQNKRIINTFNITKTASKYVIKYVKNHPNADKIGRISEHVLVISQFLNRPLDTNEFIHHKNGIRNDNRIENLELWSKHHPSGSRVEDLIEYSYYILEKYKDYKNPQ